jgi:hypothetical protein
MQKRAVNMVGGLSPPGKGYEEKLTELGLEKLSDRRTEADLTLMYKVQNGQCTVSKVLWVDMAARNNNVTRAAMDNLSLKKPFARTEKRTNYYTVRICDGMGWLPHNIRAARTASHFKSSYRAYRDSTCRGPGAQRQPINQ